MRSPTIPGPSHDTPKTQEFDITKLLAGEHFVGTIEALEHTLIDPGSMLNNST